METGFQFFVMLVTGAWMYYAEVHSSYFYSLKVVYWCPGSAPRGWCWRLWGESGTVSAGQLCIRLITSRGDMCGVNRDAGTNKEVPCQL